jgi:hypothetical protein
LNNKIHVTVTNEGFYSNGFDVADKELSDPTNKKEILETGIFCSLSRKLRSNEKLIAKLTLPNSVISEKEFTR